MPTMIKEGRALRKLVAVAGPGMTLQLPEARLLRDEVLEALRWRAGRGCERGFAETDLGDVLGVARETIGRWWAAYPHGGVEALPHERTGRPVGPGRLLSDAQEQQIQTLLDHHQPAALGIASALWTRRAVADLSERELGVRLAVRTVGAYLQRW